MRKQKKELVDNHGVDWGRYIINPFFYFTLRSSDCNVTVDGSINSNRFYRCCYLSYYGHPIKRRQKFWNLRFLYTYVRFKWVGRSYWVHYWRFSYSIFSSKVVLVGFYNSSTFSHNNGIISYIIIWIRPRINDTRRWRINFTGKLWIRWKKIPNLKRYIS